MRLQSRTKYTYKRVPLRFFLYIYDGDIKRKETWWSKFKILRMGNVEENNTCKMTWEVEFCDFRSDPFVKCFSFLRPKKMNC